MVAYCHTWQDQAPFQGLPAILSCFVSGPGLISAGERKREVCSPVRQGPEVEVAFLRWPILLNFEYEDEAQMVSRKRYEYIHR